MILKKEIKTHLVFDCLSKFTFGQGFTQLINESYLHLYHTCVKKSIEGSQFCYLLRNFAKITEMEDKRNVIDKFKGRSESEIINELDSEDHGLFQY